MAAVLAVAFANASAMMACSSMSRSKLVRLAMILSASSSLLILLLPVGVAGGERRCIIHEEDMSSTETDRRPCPSPFLGLIMGKVEEDVERTPREGIAIEGLEALSQLLPDMDMAIC